MCDKPDVELFILELNGEFFGSRVLCKKGKQLFFLEDFPSGEKRIGVT